ncbi:MAG: DUF4339 domain-containing protein [Nitrospiraceae bacterium]|nr:DUF4339 domain-containing protein [Nitrospiraceae bacterium]
MDLWFYVEKGERRGPVTDIELKSALRTGRLAPDTPIHNNTMKNWMRADQVPGFQRLEGGLAGMGPAAGDVAAAAAHLLAGVAPKADDHADFTKRTVALLLDVAIVYVIVLGLGFAADLVVGGEVEPVVTSAAPRSLGASGQLDASDLLLPAFKNLFSFSIPWLLFGIALWAVSSALFEASSWQATPGKHVVGLEVVDEQGGRITLSSSVVRTAGKLLSAAVLGFGYVLGIFDDRKQTLHDKIAKTFVIFE